MEKENFYIVARNFKCKYGEIDIIAIDKNELVFIEVKTRESIQFGEPRDSVEKNKKKHIKNVANFFVMENKLENKFIRFDVIEVYWNKKTYKINHIKNIFL